MGIYSYNGLGNHMYIPRPIRHSILNSSNELSPILRVRKGSYLHRPLRRLSLTTLTTRYRYFVQRQRRNFHLNFLNSSIRTPTTIDSSCSILPLRASSITSTRAHGTKRRYNAPCGEFLTKDNNGRPSLFGYRGLTFHT